MSDDVIPIQSATLQPSIPGKLPEDDRLRLNEVALEILMLQNGLAALGSQINQYKAQADVAQIQMGPMQQRFTELQVKFGEMLAEAKQRLNIPATWDVDPRSGNVLPPQQPPAPTR
jgi:hypothetical protein